MRYMLDTNICIQIMNHASDKMLAKLLEHEGQMCISTIAAAELRFGAAKSTAQKKNQQLLAEFLAPLRSRPNQHRPHVELHVIEALQFVS